MSDLVGSKKRRKYVRRDVTKTCMACGQVFAPLAKHRGTAKVCGIECRSLLARQRAEARRSSEPFLDSDGQWRILVGDDGASALIDEQDIDLVRIIRWYILAGHNGKVYAVNRRAGAYMHRLIARTPDGFETDHINGDGLDNRRANLRTASKSQNSANLPSKPRRPDGSPHRSVYKGVTSSGLKWVAKIQVNGKASYLGSFVSERTAAETYDRAARDAWGAFASTNFPEGGTENG